MTSKKTKEKTEQTLETKEQDWLYDDELDYEEKIGKAIEEMANYLIHCYTKHVEPTMYHMERLQKVLDELLFDITIPGMKG